MTPHEAEEKIEEITGEYACFVTRCQVGDRCIEHWDGSIFLEGSFTAEQLKALAAVIEQTPAGEQAFEIEDDTPTPEDEAAEIRKQLLGMCGRSAEV